MKMIIYSFLIGFLFTSCMKLDPFMFSGARLTADQYNMQVPGNTSVKQADLYKLTTENYQLATFKTSDQTLLYALMMRGQDTSLLGLQKPIIFYCHGNYHHMNHYQDRYAILQKYGAHIFSYDYRGYGASQGTSTAQNLISDASDAYEYFKTTALPQYFTGSFQDVLIIYGYSLGNVPCLSIVKKAKQDFNKVIVVSEAGFSAAERLMASSVSQDVAGNLLLDHDFNNVESIKEIGQESIPYLILHGKEDDFIMMENAYEMSLSWLSSYSSRLELKMTLKDEDPAYIAYPYEFNQQGLHELVIVNQAKHSNITEVLGALTNQDKYYLLLDSFLKAN